MFILIRVLECNYILTDFQGTISKYILSSLWLSRCSHQVRIIKVMFSVTFSVILCLVCCVVIHFCLVSISGLSTPPPTCVITCVFLPWCVCPALPHVFHQVIKFLATDLLVNPCAFRNWTDDLTNNICLLSIGLVHVDLRLLFCVRYCISLFTSSLCLIPHCHGWTENL